MTRYAAQTDVSSARSRDEIERILNRYKATGFMYGWEGTRAVIGFVIHNRQVRFVLPLPDRESREFRLTETGRTRTAASSSAAYEQAIKQRWRALALVIKAKLEAVETGIVSFDQEFMAQLVLPDGRMVVEHVLPRVVQAIDEGTIAALLPQSGPLALTAG